MDKLSGIGKSYPDSSQAKITDPKQLFVISTHKPPKDSDYVPDSMVSKHPKLVSRIRSAFEAAHKLREPIEPGKAQDPNQLPLDLRQEDTDLFTTKVELLKATKDFQEKAALAEAAFLIDSNQLIKDYLVPSLDGSHNFENQGNNCEFCLRSLESLEEKDLMEILNMIDINDIKNVSEFSRSLSRLSKQDLLLSYFVKAYEEIFDGLEVGLYYDEENKEGIYLIQKIQSLIVQIIQNLSSETKPIPAEPLKALYRQNANEMIREAAAGFLKTHPDINKQDFFAELISSNGDISPEGRRKLFGAVNDFAEVCGEKATDSLKELIVDSEDAHVVSKACHELIEKCKPLGINALIETIYNQVTNNEVSIPLAYVTSTTILKGQDEEVLKRVFSLSYAEKNSLVQGYRNIEGYKLDKLEVAMINNRPVVYFYPYVKQEPISVIDLFRNIGLEKLAAWAKEDKSRNTENNLIGFINYAYYLDPETMSGLVIGALVPTDDSEAKSFLLKIAGMEQVKAQVDFYPPLHYWDTWIGMN